MTVIVVKTLVIVDVKVKIRRLKKRDHPKRRNDPSPSDDTDDSGDEDQRVTRKNFRIKLQKFDGKGSWESWWAHFQNCASYNKWNERDHERQ